jgi:hypothetical protein
MRASIACRSEVAIGACDHRDIRQVYTGSKPKSAGGLSLYRIGPIIDLRGKPVNHVRLLPLSHGRCQEREEAAAAR